MNAETNGLGWDNTLTREPPLWHAEPPPIDAPRLLVGLKPHTGGATLRSRPRVVAPKGTRRTRPITRLKYERPVLEKERCNKPVMAMFIDCGTTFGSPTVGLTAVDAVGSIEA